MNYFNLTENGIERIAIYRTRDGSNCFIAESGNKRVIYNGFILNDRPRVQTICNVRFYPSSVSGKYVPRLEFKKVDKKTNELKETNRRKVRIAFSSSEEGYEQFWKLIAFLYKFKHLVDLGEFERVYKVVTTDAYISEFKNKKQAEQAETLSKLIAEANLDEEGIKQALSIPRVNIVKEFFRLLNVDKYWKNYEKEYKSEIKGSGEETAWHHFLKKHTWVLGLNLDIRFIRDLIDEVDLVSSSTKDKGSPKSDLLGIHDYTVLVELKTPNINVFTKVRKRTARANTWSFSDDFIDGISQCLGQKFGWDKSHRTKDLVKDNKIINQDLVRTIDPKTIFLIGNKSKEFPESSRDIDIITKRDTFERFRRNNRNIEIMTFDELYERAYYIAHGKRLIRT